MYQWLCEILYVIIAVQVKWVVGLLLLRICSHQRWLRITIHALLCVVTLFNIFYVFLLMFQCSPVQYYWLRFKEHPPKGNCDITRLALIPTYVSLGVNVIADFTLALLPITFVWNAKMELKTKISVVGVLGLGLLYVFVQNHMRLTDPLSEHQALVLHASLLHNPLNITKTICTASQT